ncbi:MAG TPA: hypothetical protein VFQ51_14530, partial [Vicinamibacteria bacterium]|nr:hypothetical protein [Vicinamibacteria bacterium]
VSSASCGTDCGPEDTYRIRAYETTGVIPRFNNGGSQVTVLILQNTSNESVLAEAHFWDAAGTRLAIQGAQLQPRGTSVINTASVPGLAGMSGSITVTHYGRHGAIAGKAVALEPSTGFSFDSPMGYRPR